jgi:AGCS family alanine or glycine:cation symporter
MTALTIVIAGTPFWREAQNAYFTSGGEISTDGVLVTSNAFETVLPWFPYVLTLAVALFAISTMITWGYYGQKAWTYLFGRSVLTERIYQLDLRLLHRGRLVLTLGSILNFADAVLFLLALVNIIGLYILAPVVKREMHDFRDKLRSGELRELDPSEKVD